MINVILIELLCVPESMAVHCQFYLFVDLYSIPAFNLVMQFYCPFDLGEFFNMWMN